MNHELLQQQEDRYELERTIHALEQQLPELEERVDGAGAVFMTLYEYMAEREKHPVYLIKKLLKKDDAEFIRRYQDAVDAEAQLKQAEIALEACKNERAAAMTKLIKLPNISVMWVRAKKDPETVKVFAKAEAHYCMERLKPLMDANLDALKALADFLVENQYAPKIPQSEFNELLNASIAAAEACQPYLSRYQDALEFLPNFFFQIRDYYVDPKNFIWNAKFGKAFHDRVFTAIEQVSTQKDRVITNLTFGA